jgi:predicted small lipoprotein YifL
MFKIAIISLLVLSITACGQRVAPAGPENQVIDSKSY